MLYLPILQFNRQANANARLTVRLPCPQLHIQIPAFTKLHISVKLFNTLTFKYFSMKFRKQIFQLFALIFLSMFLAKQSSAQKTYDTEGTITSFASPFDKINLMVDDDETEYLLSNSTSLSKGFKKEDLKPGQKIKIIYFLDSRDYVIKEIIVKSTKTDETLKFTGLFEFLDNDVAFVDGKKIKLAANGTLECPGKKLFKKNCGCEKSKPYRGFDDKNIRRGSYFNVEGKLNKDGIIEASKISVCKNEVTQDEIELRQSIEESYDASGLVKVKAPKGFKVPNGLSEGNIKIGNLEYKLYDDLKVQGYINMVGMRIIPEYAQDSLFRISNNIIWRFYVINSPIPNAFAYPNGMVFVYSGLLKIMENEAQLALVLGHEISHVLYEHSAQRYSKNKYLEGGLTQNAWRRVTSLIPALSSRKDTADGINSSLNSFVDRLAPQNLSGLFEKTKETQADRIGLMYMYMLGYDLREAPRFWLKMKALTGDESFQQKMNTSAKNLLQSKDLKMDKNILNQIGGKGLDAVGGALLDNIYASHPLAAQRYDDINELITTCYKDADFSKALVGVEDFKKYLSNVK
jgi:beta-barrel assembly-enhancing protease